MTDSQPKEKAPRYTDEEVAIIIAMWKAGKSDEEIGAEINRPAYGITLKRQELGTVQERSPFWSDAETETLRAMMADGRSAWDVTRVLKRSYQAVQDKIFNLGLRPRRTIRRWSEEEDKTIRTEHSAFTPIEDIADLIGRSIQMTRMRIYQLGLYRDGRKTRLAKRFGLEALEISDDPAEVRRVLMERDEAALVEQKVQFEKKVSAALDEMVAAIDKGVDRQAAIQAAMIAGATLQQCGIRLGVTRERIRQIAHKVKPYKARPPEMRTTCMVCGEKYEPKGYAQKYCSPNCRQTAFKASIHSIPVERKCAHCGNDFTASHGNRKYCSPTCNYDAMLARMNQKNKEMREIYRQVMDGKLPAAPVAPAPVEAKRKRGEPVKIKLKPGADTSMFKKIDTSQPYTLRRHKYT